MNHQEAHKLLPWYLNGTLVEEESHMVEEHLSRCDHCTRELDTLRMLRTQVVETNRQVTTPPGLLQRAMAPVHREAGQPLPPNGEPAHPKDSANRRVPWFKSFFLPRWRFAAAFAAVFVLAFQTKTLFDLRQEIAVTTSPGVVHLVTVPPNQRSSAKTVVFRPDQSFLYLNLDLNLRPPERPFDGLLFELRDDQGALRARFIEKIPKNWDGIPDNMTIKIRNKGLQPGRYHLAVSGLIGGNSNHGGRPQEHYFFLKQLKGD